MPDAARLTSALCLALLAFIVSGMIMPLFPEGTYFGYFTWINVGLGVLCGWIIMGKRAGRGVTSAINNGITGVVMMVFWALFVQGTYEMFRLAMRNRFGGPLEALASIFTIGMDFGYIILVPSVTATLLIGGILSGFAADYAKSRWH